MLHGARIRESSWGVFSTLPALSSAAATSLSSPAATPSSMISHWAELLATCLASRPLTRTHFTVPLSEVVPRTTTFPCLHFSTELITVAGGESVAVGGEGQD